ncbi:MAG: SAM-dependent chlorinase/fluorinase [Anaerolineae bacterium]
MGRTIALLTDFGTADTYVGVMKGVIHTICPDAVLIDLTHAVQPQNVRQAAFALLTSYRYFPIGTIFVVVVDPGVGSERLPLAAEVDGYFFTAPDNGVLSYVFAESSKERVYSLQNPGLRLAQVSQTFHGRDIFAPAAAHLANGVAISNVGERIVQPKRLPAPQLNIEERRIDGEVLHIDHFGNITTSIGQFRWVSSGKLTLNPRFSSADAVHIDPERAVIRIGDTQIERIDHIFSDVERGGLLSMVGSSGFLEIAVNQGDAAKRLEIAIGDRVELEVG